jgi:hypothetical protein
MPNRNRIGETSVSNYTHETVPSLNILRRNQVNASSVAHHSMYSVGVIQAFLRSESSG